MLREFYMGFENRDINSFKIKHIQYNVYQRLHKHEYITCRRIDIILTESLVQGDIDVVVDDKRRVEIKSGIGGIDINHILENDGATVYKVIFSTLRLFWRRNKWNELDIDQLSDEIKHTDFVSTISFSKKYLSPDKKTKAEFYCELFPEYTNYYLDFLNKKKELIRRIKFFKGHQDPLIFFGFFANKTWRDNDFFFLTDYNKEIYFIFNIYEDSFELEYKPTFNSLEKCKDYVRAFEPDISTKERLKLLDLSGS